MAEVRYVVEDNKMWFPIVDITRYSKEGSKLHKAATKWFKNNISEDSIKKLTVYSSTICRGGKLLCVDANNLKIIGMYERHLLSGKDFRAKWADLPDTPAFTPEIKKELSWKNLYCWSKTDHYRNSGLSSSALSELRVLYSKVAESIGEEKAEQLSYVEALKIIGIKQGDKQNV